MSSCGLPKAIAQDLNFILSQKDTALRLRRPQYDSGSNNDL